MAKRYTLEDIAGELGVSKTTVSRALSGKGPSGQRQESGSGPLLPTDTEKPA